MNAKIETFFVMAKCLIFDRKMFLIINNDKYIALNFSSIYNICNQLKSSYF